MVKTEPADRVSEEDIPKSSNGWMIASYISFAVIAGLIVLNIMPRTKGSAESEVLELAVQVRAYDPVTADYEMMLSYLFLGEYQKALKLLGWTGRIHMAMHE